MQLTKLSLFSGILGDDLASEWAGIETVCCVEIDPFCQAVIKKHYPDMPIIGDIHEVTKAKLKEISGYEWVDIISGGFPCQDISVAKPNGKGLEGKQSGLWGEYRRLVDEIRPKYVVVENVSNLVNRGLSTILRDIALLGYDAEWGCIPATSVGAPHRRKRLFVVAYTGGFRFLRVFKEYECKEYRKTRSEWQTSFQTITQANIRPCEYEGDTANIRVCDGIPDGLDRLKALGNALVPQQVYPIYKAIVEVEKLLDHVAATGVKS